MAIYEDKDWVVHDFCEEKEKEGFIKVKASSKHYHDLDCVFKNDS